MAEPPAPSSGVDPARFALLAGALAGVRVDVRWADGTPAHSDGRTIWIEPADPETVRRQIVVQAALIGGGSLDRDIMAALTGRPRTCGRYFALEAHRVLAERAAVLPGLPIASWWDGPRPPRTANPEASLQLARSRHPLPAAPAGWGAIRPAAVLRAPAASPAGAEHRPGDPTAQPGEHRAGGDSEGREDDPVLKNPLARFLRQLGDAFRAGSEGGQGEGAPSLETVGSRQPGGGGARVVRPAELPPAPLPLEPGSLLYPEWNDDRQRYRPAWCGVLEVDPPPTAFGAPLGTPRDPRFERALARLSLGVLRCRGERSGDDLWIDGVIRARVARRSGDVPFDGVYIGNRWLRRDLAVLVLVDISGSVADENDGRSVHARQRDLTHALVGALEVLGDRVAAYGFHSEGRLNVQLVRIKGFEERYDTAARRRLEALEPAAFTRLGAGIRHATRLLHAGAGTPYRLLVVLSDGLPYDDGYEGPYAEADTRRAIHEARRSGAGCLCLTLGPHNETLQRVFGTATYCASDDPAAVRADLVRLIRPALAGASRPA